jgi:anti-sigma regulatory factor (Ser/Thr protein kinase)
MTSSMTTSPATHTGLFYGSDGQYSREVGQFLRAGLEQGHRSLVIAPASRVDLLRASLGRAADEVTFMDDSVGYAPQWNAYRVLLDFAAESAGVRSRVVAEQTLAARVPAEVLDYRRLEAAVNLVFADSPVDVLCPYDAGSLPAHLLEIGLRTHATVLADGDTSPNSRFDDPAALLAGLSAVVPPPPEATTVDCSGPADVALARRLVRTRGTAVGLDPEVVADVAMAVTEVLTNALLHGAPPTLLHVYQAGPTWVCHVHDGGRGPVDPLAGLVPPTEPSDHGYGLWLARQLCTAVDVGHDRTGTHVRLHMRVPPGSSGAQR